MLITVLLPVYNGGKLLGGALDGILNQSLRDFEFLIIDDHSTDGTWEKVCSYRDSRIRAVRNEQNIGLTATLNRGLEIASGELIARQDHDDFSYPDRLKRQVEAFKERKELVAVFSRARLIDNKNRIVGWVRTPTNPAAIRWDLCYRNSFVHGSVMFRRKVVWEDIGGYHPLPACEDYDLWSRIQRNQGEIAVIQDSLLDYRIHSHSIMGQEHSEAFVKSRNALRQIMEKNCEAFFDLSEKQIAILTAAWLEPELANWTSFFVLQNQLLASQRDSDILAIRKILAEEDFSLYRKCCQTTCAVSFLRALCLVAPRRFAALPWIRILGERLLAVLGWRSPR